MKHRYEIRVKFVNPNTKLTDTKFMQVDANNRTQAAKKVENHGKASGIKYEVLDVNMIG